MPKLVSFRLKLVNFPSEKVVLVVCYDRYSIRLKLPTDVHLSISFFLSHIVSPWWHMDGTSETTLVNGSRLYSTDEMNIPKLLTLKIHFFSYMFTVIGHKLIVTSFFLWKIIRIITQNIEHVEKNFQVVTYSTICGGHM